MVLYGNAVLPGFASAVRAVLSDYPLAVYSFESLGQTLEIQPAQTLVMVLVEAEGQLGPVQVALAQTRLRCFVVVAPGLLARACDVLTLPHVAILPLLEDFAATAQLVARLHRSRESGPMSKEQERLEALGEAVLEVSLQGVILEANLAARTLLGLPQGALPLLNLEAFNADPVSPLLSAAVVSQVLREGRCAFECQLRPGDGLAFPAQISIGQIREADGEIRQLIVTCRNISVRVDALRRNREAQRRLAFHVERTPMGFVEFDGEGVITSWNPAAERIFGWAAGEIIGRHWSDCLVRPRAVESINRIFHALRTHQGGEISVNDNLTKDGRVVTCEWHNSVLINDSGEVIGFASLVNDITDRVRNEEDLRNSRSMAEEANKSKDEFLSLMNHEMRTPLNSIIGFADLLREARDPEEISSSIDTIRSNAQQLLELVDNVLAYTQLDSGRVFLAMRETDLEIILHEVSEITRYHAAEKGLAFSLHVDECVPTNVFADHEELRSLLLKQLDNAIKFTEHGEISLTVRTRPVPGSLRNRTFRFEIRDTGPGIAPESREYIFETFRQADATLRRSYGGTGLGLALCRKIVELMDGRIWVEENPGGGSCFVSEIPLSLVEPESFSVNPFPDTRPGEIGFFADHFPAEVLVLANSLLERSHCAEVLRNMGYHPEFAGDIRQLAELLQNRHFHLILLDLQAPVSVLRQVQHLVRSHRWPEVGVPQVVLLAHGASLTRAPFQGHFFDQILEKPLRQAPLQKVLRKASRGVANHPKPLPHFTSA